MSTQTLQGVAMLGLTFTLQWNPAVRRDAAGVAALDAAFRAAGAGDRRIRIAPLGADCGGTVRCTVHFSALGQLDGFVARLSESLQDGDVGLLAIEPAGPLERAA